MAHVTTKSHQRPLFDPGWAFGSQTLPAAVVLVWLIASLLPKPTQFDSYPISLALLILSPILVFVVLAATDYVRGVRERKNIVPFSFNNGSVHSTTQEFDCTGDVLEIRNLSNDSQSTMLPFRTSTVTSNTLSYLAVFVSLIGWLPHEYLGVPMNYVFGAIWGLTIMALGWRFLYRTEIEVSSGNVGLRRAGLLAGINPLTKSLKLNDTKIVCDFARGKLDLISDAIGSFRIDLDVILRRHALAAALLRACTVESNTDVAA